jgi:hypothetical protein
MHRENPQPPFQPIKLQTESTANLNGIFPILYRALVNYQVLGIADTQDINTKARYEQKCRYKKIYMYKNTC